MVNNQLASAREKKILGIVCIIAITAVLAATLWPFNPSPTNGVRWLADANGIAFDGAGLVMSNSSLDAAVGGPGSCSLELLLKPADTQSFYTILGFYTPSNPKQFLVRQWTDGLIVSHDVVGAKNDRRRAKFDVDHAFQVDKLLLLTIVSGPDGTVVYSNGQLAQAFPRFMISSNDLSGQIILGSSAVDYEPWPGEVRGLAIYSGELTPAQVLQHFEDWTRSPKGAPLDTDGAVALYSFTEGMGREIHSTVGSGPDLEIPKSFTVPHKAVLASPMKEFQANWLYVKDVLLNIGGFVPLGFVLCLYFASMYSRGKAIVLTILAAGALSFAIEVLQAFIPRRVSGTTDIITNTLGAAIGVTLARPGMVLRFLGRLRRNRHTAV
ncbi:MAG: VanZ family protein [Candidatus Sulfotelmatobacter sp.]